MKRIVLIILFFYSFNIIAFAGDFQSSKLNRLNIGDPIKISDPME